MQAWEESDNNASRQLGYMTHAACEAWRRKEVQCQTDTACQGEVMRKVRRGCKRAKEDGAALPTGVCAGGIGQLLEGMVRCSSSAQRRMTAAPNRECTVQSGMLVMWRGPCAGCHQYVQEATHMCKCPTAQALHRQP